MEISLEKAFELFDEANNYETGAQKYIFEESEIRKIATKVFGYATVTTMTTVTREIFRVIAEHHVKEMKKDGDSVQV